MFSTPSFLPLLVYCYLCSILLYYRNYGPTVYIQKQALAKGCQQVLWLFGEDHNLTEAGTMNIFVHMVNEDGGKSIIVDSCWMLKFIVITIVY